MMQSHRKNLVDYRDFLDEKMRQGSLSELTHEAQASFGVVVPMRLSSLFAGSAIKPLTRYQDNVSKVIYPSLFEWDRFVNNSHDFQAGTEQAKAADAKSLFAPPLPEDSNLALSSYDVWSRITSEKTQDSSKGIEVLQDSLNVSDSSQSDMIVSVAFTQTSSGLGWKNNSLFFVKALTVAVLSSMDILRAAEGLVFNRGFKPDAFNLYHRVVEDSVFSSGYNNHSLLESLTLDASRNLLPPRNMKWKFFSQESAIFKYIYLIDPLSHQASPFPRLLSNSVDYGTENHGVGKGNTFFDENVTKNMVQYPEIGFWQPVQSLSFAPELNGKDLTVSVPKAIKNSMERDLGSNVGVKRKRSDSDHSLVQGVSIAMPENTEVNSKKRLREFDINLSVGTQSHHVDSAQDHPLNQQLLSSEHEQPEVVHDSAVFNQGHASYSLGENIAPLDSITLEQGQFSVTQHFANDAKATAVYALDQVGFALREQDSCSGVDANLTSVTTSWHHDQGCGRGAFFSGYMAAKAFFTKNNSPDKVLHMTSCTDPDMKFVMAGVQSYMRHHDIVEYRFSHALPKNHPVLETLTQVFFSGQCSQWALEASQSSKVLDATSDTSQRKLSHSSNHDLDPT